MREHGHDFEVQVAAVGHPFGIATAGRRPEVKALSGQEKLPVLELAGGGVVVGSGAIVDWAAPTAQNLLRLLDDHHDDALT